MKELTIKVTFPGKREAIYRFKESPVRVGRSSECHLSICHEAVPRELCLAWLEDDGRTVRIEERPHLTNSLLNGKSLVTGGVSGANVELTLGPLKLRFAPEENFIGVSGGQEQSPKQKQVRPFVLAAAGLAVFLAASLLIMKDRNVAHTNNFQLLPDDPFCQTIEEHCELPVSCLERARLLTTRARELLSKPLSSPSHEVSAASLFERAAQLYETIKAPEAIQTRRKAARMKEQVRDAYRRDVVALRRSLKSAGSIDPVDMARRVSGYLIDCDGPGRYWLDGLIANTDQKKE
ncbi:MAG: hypothetical protein GY847_37510 [Proteobacteria bacterium]|nr:hypothetical protein [Pseudomonadota bacterium]